MFRVALVRNTPERRFATSGVFPIEAKSTKLFESKTTFAEFSGFTWVFAREGNVMDFYHSGFTSYLGPFMHKRLGAVGAEGV